ncbi:hypothetical protein COY27_03090 [Candidatus Woesearchaeota archaeon CG_4_10_14_0_2_um_filter_33_13]|nr:MAG: hypothetical protein COY27_03090 [Candidatus Woesearchaeota archaeon CG_4_10_14_0_2_um_filter_33_13]
MIKGLGKKIICDSCTSIKEEHQVTVFKGKKRAVHICNKKSCMDQFIASFGYTKLSDTTWSDHCKKVELSKRDFPLMPIAYEFFDKIIFQKKIELKNKAKVIIEIARPKKPNFNTFVSPYEIGVVFLLEKNTPIIKRLFFQTLYFDNLPSFIKDAEKEIKDFINKDIK